MNGPDDLARVTEEIRTALAEGAVRWSRMSHHDRMKALLYAARWHLVQEAYHDVSADELVTAIDQELAELKEGTP